MKMSNTRVRRSRWRAFSKLAAAAGVTAIVGLAAVSPARADYDDWRYRNHWREHHHHYGFGLSFSSPGYHSYPSYSYSYSYPSYGYSYSYPSYGYSYSYPSYGYSYNYPAYGDPSYGYYDYGGSDYGYDYSR